MLDALKKIAVSVFIAAMGGVLGAPFVAAAIAVSALVVPLTSNTPPPPYTDPQLATTNALGGVASSLGCAANAIPDSVSAVTKHYDLLNVASTGDCFASATVSDATTTRIIAVTWANDDGTGTKPQVCLQLGGTTEPTFKCPRSDGSGAVITHRAGGCVLSSVGQTCTFLVRPQVAGCTSWDTCHIPVWITGSQGIGANDTVNVAVYQ